MEQKVQQIKEKNRLIEERIQNIQLKVRSITCPYPDDLVLQIFIGRLAQQIEDRKRSMEQYVSQANKMMEQEREIQESINRPNLKIDR